jgi:transcriptional antiterminator RfaH
MNAQAFPCECQVEFAVRWYLIHTKPTREGVAEVNLRRQGYDVYYPRLVRPARIRGRWVDRVAPLFPRYLFLGLALDDQEIGPVRSTLGVANVVRFGNDYTPVPEAVVEDLRMRADPKTGLHRLNDHAAFKAGSRVCIVDGAFDGLEGVFQRESGGERVVLLLGLLGRDTLVQLPVAFVMPQRGSQERLAAQ